MIISKPNSSQLNSVGSVLALDRPYVATVNENGVGTSDELCLEYGSATQLYLVPCIQHEEQVSCRAPTHWDHTHPHTKL